MKKNILLTALLIGAWVNAQEKVNKEELQKIAEEAQQRYDEAKSYEESHIKPYHNFPEEVSYEGLNSAGVPVYLSVDSQTQINSMNVDYLYNNTIPGVAVSGEGYRAYIWDGGAIRTTHQDFEGRATNIQTSGSGSHSTPVAGVIVGAGINPGAKGMAYQANVFGYNYTNNIPEMADESDNDENLNYMISNHSYGSLAGWYNNGTTWYWYGYPNMSPTESALFGYYDSIDAAWDNLAYNAPQHTMFKSAGNNRTEGPSGTVDHYAYAPDGTWEFFTGVNRPNDCTTQGGYDCLSYAGSVSKNIILVGAINPIGGDNRYEDPSDVVATWFTSFGPTDDGRIKPDVTAIGQGVLSASGNSDTQYSSNAGTSFSSPAAAGVGLLLQQVKHEADGGYLRSDMMKALLTHTAFEAGTTLGPDYRFGYGLINAFGAAETLLNVNGNAFVRDLVLNNSDNYTVDVVALGDEPLKVSVAWLDPAGTPFPDLMLNDRTPMLVNDLDVRVTNGGDTFYPWKLNPDSPAAAATQADNTVDNLEQVFIQSPVAGQTYTITVNHKGTLTNGSQNFALVITGVDSALGTADVNLEDVVAIYPNPVVDKLNIQLSKQLKNAEVKVFNQMGQIVFGQKFDALKNQDSIDFRSFPAGTYMIYIKSDEGLITKKLIKK